MKHPDKYGDLPVKHLTYLFMLYVYANGKKVTVISHNKISLRTTEAKLTTHGAILLLTPDEHAYT